jgi:RimJ/RimL family protein N-acetyltransferase
MIISPGSWGPVLSGERVHLEPIDPRLAGAMLSGIPGPDLPWEQGFPLATVLGIAQTIAAAPEPLGPFLAYAIVRESDGRAIGDAGFHGPPSAEGEVEIGYALVPRARGMGLARESVELLIAWAQSQPGVRAITARVERDNVGSERLLERLGFTRDGEHAEMRRFVLQSTV